MWSEHISVQQQAPWGNYISDLAMEADLVAAGSPWLALLDSIGLIRISGVDARTFLQGQVTCDINHLQHGQAVLGAHCNAKGRAQATFVCCQLGEDFLLALPADQVAPTVQALAKYAMFSKAEVTPCTDVLAFAVGGTGDGVPESLTAMADTTLFSLPWLGTLGLTSAAAAVISTAHELNITLVGDNAWWLSQIAAGVVHITANQTEQWIPQEINYDLIEGVNFKKGCYKGQEIIARIHYRGQTKVRVFALEISGIDTLSVGDKVMADGYGGTILTVAKAANGNLRVLSTLKTEGATAGPITLEQNADAQVQLLPLPYAISE